MEAVRSGKSVHVATRVKVLDFMRRAECEGRLAKWVRYLALHSALIEDEIGYPLMG